MNYGKIKFNSISEGSPSLCRIYPWNEKSFQYTNHTQVPLCLLCKTEKSSTLKNKETVSLQFFTTYSFLPLAFFVLYEYILCSKIKSVKMVPVNL